MATTPLLLLLLLLPSVLLEETGLARTIEDLAIGPFTIHSEEWARQFVNLVLEWLAFVVHQVLIQLLF